MQGGVGGGGFKNKVNWLLTTINIQNQGGGGADAPANYLSCNLSSFYLKKIAMQLLVKFLDCNSQVKGMFF